MAQKETRVQKIVRLTSKRFPSLSTSGTDIEELVRFILAKRNGLEKVRRQNIGDDYRDRDYANTAYYLMALSSKALDKIAHIKRNEIRQRLRNKAYPFSRLNKESRETLVYLPTSWVYGSALLLLQARQHD